MRSSHSSLVSFEVRPFLRSRPSRSGSEYCCIAWSITVGALSPFIADRLFSWASSALTLRADSRFSWRLFSFRARTFSSVISSLRSLKRLAMSACVFFEKEWLPRRIPAEIFEIARYLTCCSRVVTASVSPVSGLTIVVVPLRGLAVIDSTDPWVSSSAVNTAASSTRRWISSTVSVWVAELARAITYFIM